MEIAEKIRRARIAKGLSQRALAKLIGVTHGAVAQWETNGTQQTIANKVNLASVLGIPILELLPDGAPSGEMAIRDPEEKLVIQSLRKLPPKFRANFVSMLLLGIESLDPGDGSGN